MDPITWERADSIRRDVATAGWMETLASLAVRELLSRTEPALLEAVWMPADHTIASQKTLSASTRASQVQLRVSPSPFACFFEYGHSAAASLNMLPFRGQVRANSPIRTIISHCFFLRELHVHGTWHHLSNRPQQLQQSKETYMKLQKTRPSVLQDGKKN